MTFSTDRPFRRGLLLAGLAIGVALGGTAIAAPGQLQAARDAIARGDAVSAEVALERATADGATDRAVAALWGEACLLAYDFDCARRWLAPGEFAEGEAVRGFQLLGRVERDAGNPQAAANAYDQALALDERNADLWVDIAEFRYWAGEEALAYQALAHALRLDSASPRALAMRARVIRQRDGLLPSLPLFVQAIDAGPGDLGLLLEYTAALGEAGQGAGFLAASRAAIGRGGQNMGLYLQSVLAARAGDFETARTLMERVPQGIGGQGAEILRAIIDIELGNLRNAQETLARFHDRVSDDPVVNRLYLRALALDDRNQAIVSIFGNAAEAYGAEPYLKVAVGRAFEKLGQRDRAGRLLDQAGRSNSSGFTVVPGFGAAVAGAAYERNPRNFDTTRDFVAGLIADNRAVDAARVADWFAEEFPTTRAASMLAGDTALASGANAKALRHYSRAAQIRQSDRLLLRMAHTLDRLGRSRDAREKAQTYLANRPGNALASRILAMKAAEAGDWALASELLRYLLAGPGSRDVVLLALAARAESYVGRHDDAQRFGRRAMELQPSNMFAATSYSLALQQSGKTKDEADRRAGIHPDGSRFPRALSLLRQAAAARGG
ncbi:tetratricopeptide repeat protein [Pseudoblastomonas halimionae]|uniref:Tetratricopeptide repeat protein n=1 Tax=Alteriqipengyuania halimionae TaxID=1926630 RepID=A0A6I4U0W0_9SPHN|nr:tetratricopeptide repeat protein [Alteriqipengyuania halimionae]MXP09406.1 hypothetical protein [Alteriqipengyuania halimionae]